MVLDTLLGPVRKNGDILTSPSGQNRPSGFARSTRIVPHFGHEERGAPFATEDVMLLSDGLCSSTCAQSTQAMEEQAMQSVRYDGRAGIKMLQVTDRTKR